MVNNANLLTFPPSGPEPSKNSQRGIKDKAISSCSCKSAVSLFTGVATRALGAKSQYQDCLEARSHDPFSRIRFLLVPKIGLCEHIESDLPTHGSVILKKRMHPTVFLKDKRHRQILHDIPVIVLEPN